LIIIRRALPEEKENVKAILKEANLSTAGVDEHFSNFMVVERDGCVIGTAGLEIYGDVAILRSVAIIPEFRRQGMGDGLVRAMINFADRRNIKQIYLFTQTAREFFKKFGFKTIQRECIDERCRSSGEAGLSPASATAMALDIRKFFDTLRCSK
jgi:amino-acid N-acetyltransferase